MFITILQVLDADGAAKYASFPAFASDSARIEEVPMRHCWSDVAYISAFSFLLLHQMLDHPAASLGDHFEGAVEQLSLAPVGPLESAVEVCKVLDFALV